MTLVSSDDDLDWEFAFDSRLGHPTGPLYGDPRCARSPATLCVIAERTADMKELVFTAFDVLKGRGRELVRLNTDATADLDYVWDLSPDGTRIAILKYSAGSIRVFPLDGSPSQEIVAKGWTSLQSVNWAADGKGFFVSAAATGGSTLLRVDLQGNTPRPLGAARKCRSVERALCSLAGRAFRPVGRTLPGRSPSCNL